MTLNGLLYSHSDGVSVTGCYIDSPTKEAAETFWDRLPFPLAAADVTTDDIAQKIRESSLDFAVSRSNYSRKSKEALRDICLITPLAQLENRITQGS